MLHNTSMKEAGIIVGEASSNEFYFASNIDDHPPRWEYLAVYSEESVDGTRLKVPVIAQVEKIVSSSQALNQFADVEALKKIVQAGLQDIRTWGKARVLGYLTESDYRILQPRRAIAPGVRIYVAPTDLLKRFYSLSEDEGLNIGSLISRQDAPVNLSLKGFRRHLAIIAQTGAGKCVTGDTFVTLANGTNKPIIEVDVGDKIISLNGHLKMEARKVLQLHQRSVDSTTHIKLRSGKEITVTPEHPILVFSEAGIPIWKSASSLQVGERLATITDAPKHTYLKGLDTDRIDALVYERLDGSLQTGSRRAASRAILMDIADPMEGHGASVEDAASNLIWDTIVYRSQISCRETVYDLTVETSHNFVANGIIVHNSYCAGVLIEELLKKGATTLVLDPHADYVFMSLTKDDSLHEYSNRITVYRNPSSTGRYANRRLYDVRPYEIAFEDLGYDEICDIAGVREGFIKLREAVRRAHERIKDTGRYTAQDLLEELQDADVWCEDREITGAASSAMKYIRRLIGLRVFGSSSTSIQDILKPMHSSIIDLSGLEDRAMDYIASKILSDSYNAVATEEFPYPVFIIIEEAHKFIPPEGGTYSKPVINKIAAEGRKFGVFLTLITQRPSKVDSDSLSQCNSQIIMKLTNPEDQKAVAASSERMSLDLLNDLPGLNPGEAVIVGEVTRAPVMVKVKSRFTKEGGADIDILGKLKQAKMESDDSIRVEEDMRKTEAFRGSFTTFDK